MFASPSLGYGFTPPDGYSPDSIVTTYRYKPEVFEPLEDYIKGRILNYDKDFGPVLWSHLERTSSDLESFMLSLKDENGNALYDAETANKVKKAFLLHDAGKVIQDIELWRVEEKKRVFTEEEKNERRKHGALGPTVLHEGLSLLGIDTIDPDIQEHINLIKYFMEYHHERLDQTGPKRTPAENFGPLLRIATIIDTVDGKRKASDMTTIFSEIAGAKHHGQFDQGFVQKYIQFLTCRAQAVTYPESIANFGHT